MFGGQGGISIVQQATGYADLAEVGGSSTVVSSRVPSRAVSFNRPDVSHSQSLVLIFPALSSKSSKDVSLIFLSEAEGLAMIVGSENSGHLAQLFVGPETESRTLSAVPSKLQNRIRRCSRKCPSRLTMGICSGT